MADHQPDDAAAQHDQIEVAPAVAAANQQVAGGSSVTLPNNGGVDVVVANSAGPSATSSADQYTYTANPAVTTLSPSSGPAAGGSANNVTVTGVNFDGVAQVLFGSTAASFSVKSPTQMIVTPPSGNAGDKVDIILISFNGQHSVASPVDQYSYQSASSGSGPTVTSVSDNSDTTDGGKTVTITGTGFSQVIAVYIGADNSGNPTLSQYSSNYTSTSITATVPPGHAGSAAVLVQTQNGTSSSNSLFTYNQAPPQITGLSPANGSTLGGTVVTIIGKDFVNSPSVTFGGAAATNVVANATGTQITATVPSGSAGAADVVVSTSTGLKSKAGSFNYTTGNSKSAPTITSVAPSSGSISGGLSVTITGTNFDPAQSVVEIGGQIASNVSAQACPAPNSSSYCTITATVPATANAGSVPVIVATPAGASSGGATFTYTAVPQFALSMTHSGAPTQGQAQPVTYTITPSVVGGGASSGQLTMTWTLPYGMTLSGTPSGSGWTCSVSAGSTPSCTSSASIALNASSPIAMNVLIASDAGSPLLTTATLTGGGMAANGSVTAQDSTIVKLVGVPTVTALTPAVGGMGAGSLVTITGENFSGATSVTFGSAAATSFALINNSTIQAVAPASTAAGAPILIGGAVDVIVKGPTGTSLASNASKFTYSLATVTVNLTPNTGPAAGGTSVTITGANLPTFGQVWFGGTAAQSSNLTSSQLASAVSPQNSTGNISVPITIGIVPFLGTQVGTFFYQPIPPVPTVSAISPATGWTDGGDNVTITGSNFTGATKVTIGSQPVTSFTVVSDTKITATTGSSVVGGAVNVQVTTPNGANGGNSLFTYKFKSPTVTQISPSSGPYQGGYSVTLTGTELTSTSGVTVGGAAATNVTALDGGHVSFTMPAGSLGAANVVITTQGGTATLSNGFTYDSPPVITGVSPTSGPTAGGTNVTITGTGFTGVTQVMFGATAAKSFTVASDGKSVTATSPVGNSGGVNIFLTSPLGQSAVSTSSLFTYNASTTTLALSTSKNSAPYGQALTIKATLAGGVTPGGTMTLIDGDPTTGAVVATTNVSDAVTTFSVTTLAPGAHSLSASYSGDSKNLTSSTTTKLSVTIGNASPSITLSASNVSPNLGDSVTLTATILNGFLPSGSVTFMDGATALGTGSITNNTATLVTSALTAGTHQLKAVYAGDGHNTVPGGGLISPIATLVVAKKTPQVAIIGPATVNLGQSAQFTANLSGGASPTGAVIFTDGGATIGAPATLGGSPPSATSSSVKLAAGQHSIVATYQGNASNATASSAPLSFIVKATPALSLKSSSASGALVNFTATLTNGASATGSITFMSGSSVVGTANLVNGTATLSSAALVAGPNVITAIYNGDNFNTSATSNALNLNGGPKTAAPTTTALSLSAASVAYGQKVVLTAKVTASATPTGSVTFLDGSASLGVVPLSGTGASLSLTTLSSGAHQITAVYSGDASNGGSTSSVATVTIGAQPLSVALASSAPAANVGQSVTLTATLTGGANPTGSVTFTSGSVSLGSANVSYGVATLTTTQLPQGQDSVTAAYSGDSANRAASSSPLTINVTQAPIVTLSGPASITLAQAAILTATIPNASVVHGPIAFTDGGAALGSVTPSSDGNGNLTATLNVAKLTAGAHRITATYNSAASNVFTISVQATPTLTLTAPQSANAGAAVTFSVTLSNAYSPTGTVTFSSGSNSLGSATLTNGVATFSTTALVSGKNSITAVYSGDAYNAGATSQTANVTVGAPASAKAATTSLSLNAPTSSLFGQSVNLTASVVGGSSPTGSVIFTDRGVTIGNASLSGTSATLTLSSLALGPHQITATYAGDAQNKGSTSNVASLTVNAQPLPIAVTASPNTPTPKTAIILTATLTGGSSPTGAVTFNVGSTSLGTANISGGVAVLTNVTLPAGGNAITAVYAGDSQNAGATSSPLVVTVNGGATQISLSGPSTIQIGGSAQLSATINASIANGPVSFLDGGKVIGSITATSSGANLVATLTATGLSAGSHNIVASYNGATSNILTVAVQVTPVVTLSGPATAAFGAPATYSATLSNANTPSGSVTFSSGASTLGVATVVNGVATFSTNALIAGQAQVKAVYSGDALNASATSNVVSTSVGNAPPAIAVTFSASSVGFGSPLTVTATLSGGASATGTVTFTDGSTTLGTASVSAGAASYTTSALAIGTHYVTALYSGGSSYPASTSNAASVVVTKAAATVSLSPGAITNNGTVQPLTATIANAVNPTGTISFFDGSQLLGSVTVSSVAATFTAVVTQGAGHSYTAVYNGDANNAVAQSQPVIVTGAKSPPALVVSFSTPSPVYGSPVTIIASLTGGASPTGTVTFKDGSATLGSGAISAGGASLIISTLTTGSHSITAVYAGDGSNGAATSAAVNLSVSKASPTIAVTSNSSSSGGLVTLTATISGGVTPTGMVTFSDNGTTLGASPVSGAKAVYYVSALKPGAHHFVARYSGDVNNTSASSSNSAILAAARPDPTVDSEVSGVGQAQMSMATRFAQTQIDSTFRRLEQLHSDEEEQQPIAPRSPFGTLSTTSSASQSAATAAATPRTQVTALPPIFSNDPTRPLDQGNDAGRAFQAVASNLPSAFSALDRTGVLPFHIWSAGSVEFGHMQSNGAYDNRFSTSGMTLGGDMRLFDRLKAGLAFSGAFDSTSVGTNGSKVSGQSFNVSLYSSYRIVPHLFFDTTLGFGSLSFDSSRWSTAGNVMLSGHRGGANMFGMFALTQDHQWGDIKLSTYGRLDFIRSMLNSYGEAGSALWALSYGALDATTLSSVAGGRLTLWTVATDFGPLTPSLRAEYRHNYSGAFDQNLIYQAGGPTYNMTGLASARDMMTGGLSLKAAPYPGVAVELEYLVSGALGQDLLAQQIRAQAKVPF